MNKLMPVERHETVAYIRNIDRELWAQVKAQAKADGMFVHRWIERVLRRELQRTAKKEQE